MLTKTVAWIKLKPGDKVLLPGGYFEKLQKIGKSGYPGGIELIFKSGHTDIQYPELTKKYKPHVYPKYTRQLRKNERIH